MMKRYFLSLVIMFAGLGWLAVGAPVWSGQSLLQPGTKIDVENPSCDPEDEECREKIAQANREASDIPLASQEQKDKAKEIILADPVVQQFLSGREEGKDYWLRFDHPAVGEDKAADKQGFVLVTATLYLDPPVDYSGPIPEMTRPCEGHTDGDEGYVAKDNPCRNVTVEYLTKEVKWKSQYTVFVTANLSLTKVVDLYATGMIPEMWPDEIGLKEAE
ncbi:MAG: hypothetical protein QME79_13365 [Bacillota bacterium]|nr:hypothetical protein [Bacillota bacterium]